MLVYPDGDRRDAAFTGTAVHDAMCPLETGDLRAGLAGNWLYLVGGDGADAVLAEAMDSLDVELTPDAVVCTPD
jgi:hypothetical protein